MIQTQTFTLGLQKQKKILNQERKIAVAAEFGK